MSSTGLILSLTVWWRTPRSQGGAPRGADDYVVDGAPNVLHTPTMSPVNRLLTLLSLTTVVITVERASPTTRVLLQPYNFLRLHELVQMGIISAFSVIISFLLLRELTDRFRGLQDVRGTVLGAMFVVGTYFYATGNGAHEVSSFLYNQFCDTKHPGSGVCGSAYFDDYYFGNIVYFLGLGLSNLALVLLELRRGAENGPDRMTTATVVNGLVLALTFVAYDAFDRVAVGLIATLIYAVVFGTLLLRRRDAYRLLPFTVYSVIGFLPAAIVALPIRLR
jgi:hypothetical protein